MADEPSSATLSATMQRTEYQWVMGILGQRLQMADEKENCFLRVMGGASPPRRRIQLIRVMDVNGVS